MVVLLSIFCLSTVTAVRQGHGGTGSGETHATAEPNREAADNGLGTDTKAHASRVIALLLKTAEKGSVKSQTCLGYIYRSGVLIPMDATKAAKWYRRAAEAGDTEAMYALGRLYFAGNGVPQSDANAAKWFREAAREGHVAGQAMYGYLCARGRGVPLDYALAWDWLTRGAAQGSASAMHNLGLMHVTGTGVPRDLVEAYKWFTLAAPRLRVEPRMTALRMRAGIAVLMTFEEVVEAERLAREWEDE